MKSPKFRHKAVAYAATAVLASGIAVFVAPSGASAHGAMMAPGSRTYLCWRDSVGSTGAAQPKNPACVAAVAKSGTNSIYNWFAVLRSDGAGRTSGFIPDGQLCSGGTGGPYDFTGYNLARNDWPKTHLTAGANFNWKYSNWAAHPGTFRLYVTKDSWSPTRPLAWSDLESSPFLSVTNPAQQGSVGTEGGHYYWSGRLPSGKSGNHIIYSVWARSDSNETFYNCSDVVFDGGNGNVTGLGADPNNTSSVSSPSSEGSSSSSSGGHTGHAQCSASYQVSSSWQGGYQANVVVKNTGSDAIGGWAVNWTLPSGQEVTQVWNGSLSKNGSEVSVSNVGWNGAVNAGATATFGLLASGSAGEAPAMSCTTS